MPMSATLTSTPPVRSTTGGHRRDLTLFLSLAFLVSWAAWAAAIAIGGSVMDGGPAYGPYVFGAFGPLTAALVVRLRRRRRGEPAPAHAVRTGRGALLWTPLMLVLASGTVLIAAVIAHAGGGPAPSAAVAKDTVAEYGGLATFLVGILVSGPLSEEPGWRGTAYPRMRATMGRFRVGLVLGVIWAVWHLPLFFIEGTVQKELGLATPSGVLFAVSTIPMALLTAYAYERAGVVASMAVHFATNLTMVLLDVHAPVTQAMIIGIQGLAAVLLMTTAAPRSTAPAAVTRS
ncbi:CPBP family intramembrane glutamic endopeptidase [Streptomyces sp. NPDC059786]|uniref:CPBP family intramembrane glutamic endopeptidase n=1 Tax=Streptomyces sp. NPDC059786 TaxID=3346946 RepID=UPI00364EA733